MVEWVDPWEYIMNIFYATSSNRNPSVVHHETPEEEIRKIQEETEMSFTHKALKNIIMENIDDRVVVGIAGRLYQGYLPCDQTEKLEYKLTQILLNKHYEQDKSLMNKIKHSSKHYQENQ